MAAARFLFRSFLLCSVFAGRFQSRKGFTGGTRVGRTVSLWAARTAMSKLTHLSAHLPDHRHTATITIQLRH